MSSGNVRKYFSRIWLIVQIIACAMLSLNLACDDPPPNKKSQPYTCLLSRDVEPGIRVLGESVQGPGSNYILHLRERGMCNANHFKLNTIPGEVSVNYYLYTRGNADSAHVLFPGVLGLLQGSTYNPNLKTKVIIHGFYDNLYDNTWMQKMKNAFLAESDYNIILVDWNLHNGFPYSTAMDNCHFVAQGVANLILFLVRTTTTTTKNFHVVGHGLGSQIAALSGRIIRNLGRITALDPLEPVMPTEATPLGPTPAVGLPVGKQVLDPSDAVYVDVIHTNVGDDVLNLASPMGHSEFYPNGGAKQPGCENAPPVIVDYLNLNPEAIPYLNCDHFRACDYFIESINALPSGCASVGVACSSWEAFTSGQCATDCAVPGSCAAMGFEGVAPGNNSAASKTQSRKYFLHTSAAPPPFCAFQYQFLLDAVCLSNDCMNLADPGFGYSLGFIKLTLGLANGEFIDVSSNSSIPAMLSPVQYTYTLAMSQPLAAVENALAWWDGGVSRGTPLRYSPIGINRLTVVPIVVRRAATPASAIIVLCTPRGQLLEPNQNIDLSTRFC